jgi:Pupal cuticle protein C1
LAIAQAGIISSPAAVAYASPEYSSYTKTVSHTAPKTYVHAQPAAVATYHYPEQHYAPSVQYHHEPSHAIIATPQHYEHGHSEQNIVRSAHGTVSQTSKVVQTPTSSVRKSDTRITNDGYKTLSYAEPAHAYVAHAPATTYAVHQPTQYVHSAPTQYVHSAPTQYVHSSPAQYVHSSPAVVSKTVVSQPQVHTYSHATPVATYSHAAPVHAYSHASPVIAKVHYSPAVEVAHASYESPIAHYSW